MPRVLRANRDQAIACWRINSQEWSDGLTTAQHVSREQAQVETYPDGETESGLPYQINWILVPDDFDDSQTADETTILGACESLLRPALLATGSGTRHVSAYGIASVFVSPRYRGRGHATLLLRTVNEALQRLAAGSALWSDIGPDFYATLGWLPHESRQVVLSVAQQEAGPTLQRGTWVVEADLRRVCARDCELIERDLTDRCPSPRAAWSFLPTADVMRWHYARMRYMSSLSAANQPPERLGYEVDGGHVLWTLQPSKKGLTVLRMRYTDNDTLRTLLRAALTVARENDLARVVVWDGRAGDLDRTQLQYVEEARKGSLSALRVRGESNVQWLNNEKFCWC